MSTQEFAEILPLLKDRKESNRIRAVRQLAALNTSSAVEPLIGCLRDPSVEVRALAAEVLGKLCDPRVVDPLVDRMKDEQARVRQFALVALSAQKDGRAFETLTRTEADADNTVRETAKKVLAEWESDQTLVERLVGWDTATGDDSETVECPKCGMVTGSTALFCPGCGRNFKTNKDEVGPFSFAFPEVKSAYQPSGRAESTSKRIMYQYGMPAAIVGAFVLRWLHGILGDWWWSGGDELAKMSLYKQLVFLFGGLFLFALMAVFFMLIVKWVIERGIIAGKCRSETLAEGVLWDCGMAACVVYFVTNIVFWGAEGIDTIWDWIRLASIMAALLITAKATRFSLIREQPFSEACQTFMRKIAFDTIPIRYEKALLERLATAQLENVGVIIHQKDRGALFDKKKIWSYNFLEFTFWYCPLCVNEGFVQVKTMQSRQRFKLEKGQPKSEIRSLTRLVCSQPIEHEGIKTLLR